MARVGMMADGGAPTQCFPVNHDTEVVQRETFIEEALPEYQELLNAMMLLVRYRTGEGQSDSLGHTL